MHMNCLSTIGTTKKPRDVLPDIWYKLNGDILDYGLSNFGKSGATVTTTFGPQYTVYLNRRAYQFFPDTYSTGNYISLPAKLTRSPTMTFSCFINVNPITPSVRIFDFGTSFQLHIVDATTITINNAFSIPLQSTMFNAWKHIAFTVNKLELIVYENGVMISTITMINEVASDASFGFIGHPYDVAFKNYSGIMSDFRIYKRVLSSTEISDIFQKNPTLI